jgi:phosphoglycolate phosphatase-like HAD superfamily hydrolase
MSIKAIFYDFDGVIKESVQIKTEAFYALYEQYGTDIATKAKRHHIENGGVSRYEKFKYYHKTFLNIELDENGIEELAEQFSDIVMKKVISCDFVDGARESVEKLTNEYMQFIVTGTPQNEIEHILKNIELTHCFDGIYGSPENKIDISQRILDNNDFTSSEIVFIGDATTDYKAATHHDFKFILRVHDENEQLFNNIDVVKINDLTKLQGVLENI